MIFSNINLNYGDFALRPHISHDVGPLHTIIHSSWGFCLIVVFLSLRSLSCCTHRDFHDAYLKNLFNLTVNTRPNNHLLFCGWSYLSYRPHLIIFLLFMPYYVKVGCCSGWRDWIFVFSTFGPCISFWSPPFPRWGIRHYRSFFRDSVGNTGTVIAFVDTCVWVLDNPLVKPVYIYP